MLKFPDGFYFGASTSSHQVEGDCYNDWTEWEKQNSKRLAFESVKYKNLHSWDRIKEQALDPCNYISGKAADHYNLYAKDLDLAVKIGLNAYRFSIEWSRIEPDHGHFNIKEINHYKSMIDAMQKRGIEPFVTVWHWTLPLWLSREGGILHPDFPELFARYAEKLSREFGRKVRFYILINEPEIYSLNGYLRGVWPPQKKGPVHYIRAIRALIKAHNTAYPAMKKAQPDIRIGTACNMNYFDPGNSALKKISATLLERIWNRYFTDRIIHSMDFAGLNYYMRKMSVDNNSKFSDMGWELFPEGILPVLMKLKRYNVPVYITENGLADAEDINREWFIKEILRSVHKAIQNGVDIKGYFHWSLLDNFEWDKGFWPEFGLIAVDRKTKKRNIRKSALRYKQIITKGL